MSPQVRTSLQHLTGLLFGAHHSKAALLHHAWNTFSSTATPPSQSAAIIKQLREKSGAPISDVKNMLVLHEWDVDKAYEALRKKGLAAAAKKASRHAAEGLVGASFASSEPIAAGASLRGGTGSVVVVELNSETDFVARNSLFQDLLRDVMGAAHTLGAGAAVGPDHQLNLDQLMAARTRSGATVSEAVTAVAAQVRENVRLRRAFRVDSGGGLVYSYVHQPAAPGLGKLASVVVLKAEDGQPLREDVATAAGSSSDGASSLMAVGEGLAMHVAGMRPAYLHRGVVPAEVLERERGLLGQQLAQDVAFRNKPPQVLAKVVEGRLSKTLADWCLAEQPYVLDDSVTVEKMVARLRKQVGRPVQVSSFLRVQCGEGLGTKSDVDFATEVARIVSEA